MNRPPSSAALTLVELAVAMTIVAILVAISVPAVNHMLESGRVTTCLSNLRQLGAALNNYLGENNATLPKLEMARPSKDAPMDAIDTVLRPYVQDIRVFACPSDNTKHLAEHTGTSYFWNSAMNEQRVGALDFLKITSDPSRIPLIGDKEGFHPYLPEKVNILYADGHASKHLIFKTDKSD
jgi:prepilin-type processing-associated H-X9-DG protein